ncbi:MAG: NAD(P)/FAD-dependent oxidoreductase [Solirubrobacterales bacterium]|nr:NAD(P)/FAD-dependent oxidoreductase [Solirubrobacterales bacterium]
MSDAVVVGSGPNGLSGAVALAREGMKVTVLEAEESIGGGTRSAELTLPGVVHDVCSAVHPLAVGSPFLRSLELERHGLEWRWPEIDCAHPLDDGSAGVMLRSIEATAEALGADGGTWRRIFGPPAASFDALGPDLLRPVVHLPRHPGHLVRFGVGAASPATLLARAYRTPQAQSLFGGVAAHLMAPLNRPLSSAVGMALVCSCHAYGWAVAGGGSQAIADALAAALREHGGSIETGVRVRSLAELSEADVVLLDLEPSRAADLAGERLPGRVAWAYRRYRHGPAAYKVDFAVEGGVPWRNLACRQAGTVHVGGSFPEIVAGEREVNRGRMPERPFVLVSQQYLADPRRSVGEIHPVWSYAHVPNGFNGRAERAIIDQIERFAPGFRDRIVATAVISPAQLEARNQNYIGGDIITGANTPWQVLVRPRPALDPYTTGIPGVFICSAATPPGAGAHGMCGYNAAQSALRWLDRRQRRSARIRSAA